MPKVPEHESNTETLNERYKMALEAAEKGNIVAIKLLESGNIKYRLVLRKTQRGVIHTLEIMETETNMSPIRIDLLGNFQQVLDSADRILSEMSMDDFRQVKNMLLSLKKNSKEGGGT